MKNYKMTIALLTEEAEIKKAKELAKAKTNLSVNQDRQAFERVVSRLLQIKSDHDELLDAAALLKSASAKGD